MRFISFKSLITISLSICISLFLNACTTTTEVRSASSSSSSTSNKSNKKNVKHIHESNPCTAAVTHAHANNFSGHQHSYNCENTNKFVGNAHTHAATNVSKRTRHVHPNGANKHSHLR